MKQNIDIMHQQIDTVSYQVDSLSSQVLEKLTSLEQKLDGYYLLLETDSAIDWATYIPILVVAIAGIVALAQVKSNVITQSRVKWNEELRFNVSKYLGTIAHINRLLIKHRIKSKVDEKNKIADNIILELRILREQRTQIELLLSGDKQEYRTLFKAMWDFEKELNVAFKDGDELDVSSKSVVIRNTTRKLLMDSWVDTKAFVPRLSRYFRKRKQKKIEDKKSKQAKA